VRSVSFTVSHRNGCVIIKVNGDAIFLRSSLEDGWRKNLPLQVSGLANLASVSWHTQTEPVY
jgi:hypothetical protein